MLDLKELVLNKSEYKEAWKEFKEYSDNWKQRVSRRLLSETLEIKLKENGTLGEFLYGSGGYFDRNPNTYAVIFVKERLVAEFSSEEYSRFDENALGEQCNAVPLCFERPSENQDLERKSMGEVLSVLGFSPVYLPLPSA